MMIKHIILNIEYININNIINYNYQQKLKWN